MWALGGKCGAKDRSGSQPAMWYEIESLLPKVEEQGKEKSREDTTRSVEQGPGTVVQKWIWEVSPSIVQEYFIQYLPYKWRHTEILRFSEAASEPTRIGIKSKEGGISSVTEEQMKIKRFIDRNHFFLFYLYQWQQRWDQIILMHKIFYFVF